MKTAKIEKYTAVQFNHHIFGKSGMTKQDVIETSEILKQKVLNCVDVTFYQLLKDGCGIHLPVFAKKSAKRNGDYGPAYDLHEIFRFKKGKKYKISIKEV